MSLDPVARVPSVAAVCPCSIDQQPPAFLVPCKQYYPQVEHGLGGFLIRDMSQEGSFSELVVGALRSHPFVRQRGTLLPFAASPGHADVAPVRRCVNERRPCAASCERTSPL
jgi:hypothetical protein